MLKVIFATLLSCTFLFSFSDISNEELQEFARQNAVVVDVRLQDEWQQSGVIANSFLITYFDKSFQPQKAMFIAELNKITGGNKNREIVVVCRSGSRSKLVSGILEREGYKRVFNLKDGILGWYAHRLPLAPFSGALKNVRP